MRVFDFGGGGECLGLRFEGMGGVGGGEGRAVVCCTSICSGCFWLFGFARGGCDWLCGLLMVVVFGFWLCCEEFWWWWWRWHLGRGISSVLFISCCFLHDVRSCDYMVRNTITSLFMNVFVMLPQSFLTYILPNPYTILLEMTLYTDHTARLP